MMREQSDDALTEEKKLEELEADLLIFGRRQNPSKSLLLISTDGQEDDEAEQAASHKSHGELFTPEFIFVLVWDLELTR
jgi:hypothetical protein